MVTRKTTPTDVETAILTKSGRRCAICFGLKGDLDVKKGQIAHLDKNPSNWNEGNLAFLCLDHHADYDSQTSQSKGFTISEVKTYRAKLYDRLASTRSRATMGRRSEERRKALLEILGDIAPDILTVLHVAPAAKDREQLSKQMKTLHKRLERFRPLFHDDPSVTKALTRLGNIGGSAVSQCFSITAEVFEMYKVDVATLESALAREEGLDG